MRAGRRRPLTLSKPAILERLRVRRSRGLLLDDAPPRDGALAATVLAGAARGTALEDVDLSAASATPGGKLLTVEDVSS